MASDREAVLQKFATLKSIGSRARRTDFKGLRRRINLRMHGDIISGLQLIKLATGEDKNSFCERVLKDAITAKLQELKIRHDEHAWQALTEVAKRSRQT